MIQYSIASFLVAIQIQKLCSCSAVEKVTYFLMMFNVLVMKQICWNVFMTKLESTTVFILKILELAVVIPLFLHDNVYLILFTVL